jgi:hypothetical protein
MTDSLSLTKKVKENYQSIRNGGNKGFAYSMAAMDSTGSSLNGMA